MPRIKRVFDNPQLCHVFAAGVQDTGRGSNLFFERTDELYSYGYHYCLAKRYRVGEGTEYQEYILVNSRSYSMSTQRHRSYFYRAIRGRNVVSIEVPNPKDATDPVNETYLLDQIANSVADVWSRSRHSTMPDNEIWNLNTYYKLIGSKKVFTLDNDTYLDLTEIVREKLHKDHERQAIKDAKRKERVRLEALKYADLIPLWVKRQTDEYIPPYAFPYDFCRLSSDAMEVETSSGARVPLAHAKLALGILNRGGIITGQRIGHFKIETMPDSEGFIKIGCHRINVNQVREVIG